MWIWTLELGESSHTMKIQLLDNPPEILDSLKIRPSLGVELVREGDMLRMEKGLKISCQEKQILERTGQGKLLESTMSILPTWLIPHPQPYTVLAPWEGRDVEGGQIMESHLDMP